MAAVEEYFAALLPVLSPLQVDQDGPIILMQIENEYGAFGSDKPYLQALTDLTRGHGITVPLTTIDQPTEAMLTAGSLPGLHLTASFGSRSSERLQVLRRHQPTGPLMCAEFWDGWFDHWGEHHHTTDVAEAAYELDALLAAGASVNIYMFHGGTNFGFTNGANHKGLYKSHVTSYDYDAPLDESGQPTEKYHAFKAVLARYADVSAEAPPRSRPASTPQARLTEQVPLRDVRDQLGDWQHFGHPPTMDQLRHYEGFCLYRADMGGRGGVLEVAEVRDRAIVSVDGNIAGVLERDRRDRALVLPQGQVLELLVEDRGRVNYGSRLGEPKGLIGAVCLDGAPLRDWDVLALDLTHPDTELFDAAVPVEGPVAGPALVRSRLQLDQVADLFLDTGSWGKGVVWVNGFSLGRYWSRGPQQTLYVPAGTLRAGENDLVVFELHALCDPRVRFLPGPDLGSTED